MKLRDLLNELRERRVGRALAAYGVAAFVVVQVADATFEPLHIPTWGHTLVVALAVLGAPIVAAVSWAFDWKDGGMSRAGPPREPGREPDPGTGRGPRRGRLGLVGGVVILAAAVAFVAFRLPAGPASDELDATAVAILPFQVSSAGESLDYLEEGLVVLLGSVLGGDGGLRAVDPRASLATWRDASEQRSSPTTVSEQVARSLGAGRWLTGEVVGSGPSLVLTARMSFLGGDAPVVATVSGSVDSLPRLVEELAVLLLSREFGEERERISSLQKTSLEAVRAYLDGQRAIRAGEYREADRQFSRALDIDSTFALAALGLAESTGWGGSYTARQRALRLGWQARDRLNARDRAVLTTYTGSSYPSPPTLREGLRDAETALRLAPDRPESAYLVGDLLFHEGGWLGITDAMERAERLFVRALELDPSFAGPIEHLMSISILRGDSATAVQQAEQYMAANPDAERREYVRWVRDLIAGHLDTSDIPGRLDRMGSGAVRRAGYLAAYTGAGAQHLGAIATAQEASASTEGQVIQYATDAIVSGLNNGHPEIVSRALERLERAGGWTAAPWWIVQAALYWSGDPTRVEESLRTLTARAGPMVDRTDAFDVGAFLDQVVVMEWRLHHGDTTGLGAWNDGIDALNRLSDTWPQVHRYELDLMAATIAALVEGLETTPATRHPQLDRLDSLLVSAPPHPRRRNAAAYPRAALTALRLHERYGNPQRALAASRMQNFAVGPALFRSAFLREEGRLAALTGDRAGAIEAYRQYLALRPDPQGRTLEDAERVRVELARLLSDS